MADPRNQPNETASPGTCIGEAKDPKNTGKHEPMVWVATYGKGRVCNNALGHDVEAMKSSDGFKVLLVRGVEWAATGKASYSGPGVDKKP
jgi:type 1 glutamine amidotransferase